MRALTLVLLLVVANASSGEAIAGKTRILVVRECGGPYWVPLTGGTVEPISNLPLDGGSYGCEAFSAAYDGERFLVNVGGRNAAFLEEGAFQPSQIVELDDESTRTSSRVEWDGTRYIAAWHGSAGRFGALRGAALTRDGVINDRFTISNSRRIAGLAVNNGKVLVLDAAGEKQPIEIPIDLRVTATILDEKLTPRHSFVVGREYVFTFYHDAAMLVDVLDAVPFGDGFYVAWAEEGVGFGQLSEDAIVRGTRISADGAMLDITPSMNGRHIARNAPSRDVDLVTAGQYLMAVVKRADGGPVVGVFIDKNGLPIGTRGLLASSGYELLIETVRMPDGTLALLTKPLFSSTATVTPINDAPPLPRRRAVR